MHHHLGRALYRRLVQLLEHDYGSRDTERAREILLHACEMTMMRLANEREYFAAPERFLFNSIRVLYPSDMQTRVRRIIDEHLAVATGLAREEVAA